MSPSSAPPSENSLSDTELPDQQQFSGTSSKGDAEMIDEDTTITVSRPTVFQATNHAVSSKFGYILVGDNLDQSVKPR